MHYFQMGLGFNSRVHVHDEPFCCLGESGNTRSIIPLPSLARLATSSQLGPYRHLWLVLVIEKAAELRGEGKPVACLCTFSAARQILAENPT